MKLKATAFDYRMQGPAAGASPALEQMAAHKKKGEGRSEDRLGWVLSRKNVFFYSLNFHDHSIFRALYAYLGVFIDPR